MMKLSGVINNCALNGALPSIIEKMRYFNALDMPNSEQELEFLRKQEPETQQQQKVAEFLAKHSDIFRQYLRLKDIFAEYYGLNKEALTWQHITHLLLDQYQKNFDAAQLIFAPILRRFADEEASYLASIIPQEAHAQGAFLSVSGTNGKYNQLTAKEAAKCLYAPLGIELTVDYHGETVTEQVGHYSTHENATLEYGVAHFDLAFYSSQFPPEEASFKPLAVGWDMTEITGDRFPHLASVKSGITSGQAVDGLEDGMSDFDLQDQLFEVEQRQTTFDALVELRVVVRQAMVEVETALTPDVEPSLVIADTEPYELTEASVPDLAVDHGALYDSVDAIPPVAFGDIIDEAEIAETEVQTTCQINEKIETAVAGFNQNAEKYKHSLAVLVSKHSEIFKDVKKDTDVKAERSIKAPKRRYMMADIEEDYQAQVDKQIEHDAELARELQYAEFRRAGLV